MRQDLQSAALAELEFSRGAPRPSPQRAHTGPLWAGNSVQQTSQIGTEESRGRGRAAESTEGGKKCATQ